MNWIIRNPGKEGPMQVNDGEARVDSVIELGPQGKRFRLLPRLAGGISVFALLYCSSYAALLWFPPYEGMDMKSRLAADYNAWTFVVFQPVDSAVIEEIRKERSLPEQLIIDGWLWPTLTSTLTMPATASDTSTSTPQATSDNFPSSPSAFPPTYTSTTIPTSVVVSPQPTATPQPTGSSSPPATGRPSKARTPKPHKTPKPK